MFQACAPSSPSLDLELTSHTISVLFQCERIPTNRVWKDIFLYLPRDQARLCFLNRINVGIGSVSFQGDRAETLKWCTLFSWVKDCMVMMHHVNGDNKMQLTWWYDSNQLISIGSTHRHLKFTSGVVLAQIQVCVSPVFLNQNVQKMQPNFYQLSLSCPKQ